MDSEKCSNDTSRTRTRCTIWKKRTCLERFLILISLAMLVALLVIIGVQLHEKPASIVRNMDTSLDPCEDFYNFSCGAFLKTPFTPILFDLSHISIREERSERITRLTKELLEIPYDEKQPEFVRKMKQYYQACLNRSEYATDHILELLDTTGLKIWPIIQENDAYMSSIETTLAITEIYGGENPIFRISRSGNSTTGQFHFKPGSTVIDNEVLLNTTDIKYITWKDRYKELLEYIFYKLKIPVDMVQPEVEEIIEFETNLANITYEVSQNPEENETETTLKEFSSNCPAIEWTTFVSKMYDYFNRTDDFNDEISIKIPGREHTQRLCEFLSNANSRTLYNYLVWCLVVRHVNSIHPFYLNVFGEVDINVDEYIPNNRKQHCLSLVSYNEFTHGLSYLVIKNLRPENAINEVYAYVDEVRKAMDNTFSEESWLGSISRSIARKKLNDIQSTIGYSPGSLDIELLEKYYTQINVTDSWLENSVSLSKWNTRIRLFNDTFKFTDHINLTWPLSRGAYYWKERIVINLGRIIRPYFMVRMPKYFNYGDVGSVIAHEFMHAFDKLDSERNDTIIWPEETIEEFKQRKQCYIDQYSKFPIGRRGAMLNGTQTARENIADNSGIIQAYKAYGNFLEQNGPEPTLPGLEFTNEQMFFIRFAQLWCELLGSEEALYGKDSHSPARSRITGSMRNFPRFSEAFNCPLGSIMNPKDKCRMYG